LTYSILRGLLCQLLKKNNFKVSNTPRQPM
jgi:hypothetical protein